MNIVRKKYLALLRYVAERRGENLFRTNKGLWDTLQDYLKKSGSTGCSYMLYAELYKYVRKFKPCEILECGTGISTVVLAYALMENGRDSENPGGGRHPWKRSRSTM